MTSTDIYDPCHKAGGMSSYAWEDDPKRLTFTLARYKHVAKMLEGYKQVIEVGCSDGFGSRIVRQHVRYLKAIDLDQQAIEEAKIAIKNSKWWVDFECMSIYDYVFDYKYDACYCLDVFEHVPKTSEDKFLAHLHKLAPVCIVGTPSLESQKYASKLSKEAGRSRGRG